MFRRSSPMYLGRGVSLWVGRGGRGGREREKYLAIKIMLPRDPFSSGGFLLMACMANRRASWIYSSACMHYSPVLRIARRKSESTRLR
jgi:hypothetical protein